MRQEYQKLTEEEAITLLDRVMERATKINASTRHCVSAFALRAETAIAVLKSNPALIEWQRQRDLQYRPTYRGWVVVITRIAMESAEFRRGFVQ